MAIQKPIVLNLIMDNEQANVVEYTQKDGSLSTRNGLERTVPSQYCVGSIHDALAYVLDGAADEYNRARTESEEILVTKIKAYIAQDPSQMVVIPFENGKRANSAFALNLPLEQIVSNSAYTSRTALEMGGLASKIYLEINKNHGGGYF